MYTKIIKQILEGGDVREIALKAMEMNEDIVNFTSTPSKRMMNVVSDAGKRAWVEADKAWDAYAVAAEAARLALLTKLTDRPKADKAVADARVLYQAAAEATQAAQMMQAEREKERAQDPKVVQADARLAPLRAQVMQKAQDAKANKKAKGKIW
jgi:hypothetical protein